MRKIPHNPTLANTVNPHKPEPPEPHHLLKLLLAPALPHANIFTIRRRVKKTTETLRFDKTF